MLQIQYSGNIPNLDCLYRSSRGGSTDMNNFFGLPPTFVTWDNKVTSTQKPFKEYESSEKFQNYDMDSRFLPPSLICAICAGTSSGSKRRRSELGLHSKVLYWHFIKVQTNSSKSKSCRTEFDTIQKFKMR